MDDLLNLFNILSDKTRMRILLLLMDHELCVCELFAALDMSQPRVSRQLALLKQSKLIKDRRDGKWIYYKIDENEYTSHMLILLNQLKEWLNKDAEYVNDKQMLNKVFHLKNSLQKCECMSTGGDEFGKEELL